MHNLEPLLIQKEDFDCIGQVSKHCNWDQLSIFIREQQNLSLLPKVGQCVYDKLLKYCEGWCLGTNNSVVEAQVLKHLFIGGRYTACDGTSKVHFGLKRMLVHWAYGAYVYRHGLIDTPFGVVQKVNQDSIPADLKYLEKINVEQRNNAEYYWQLTRDYLCSVRDSEILADCNICDCISDCLCNTCTGKGMTKQRRGMRFSNVSKFD